MSKLADALRELLELISDADVIPSTAHNPVEWDTVLSAAIHNARAALAADGWQPIETAPQDGTRCLIYVPREPSVSSDNTFDIYEACYMGDYSGGNIWFSRGTMIYGATRWQPLPAPPKE